MHTLLYKYRATTAKAEPSCDETSGASSFARKPDSPKQKSHARTDTSDPSYVSADSIPQIADGALDLCPLHVQQDVL